MVVVAELPYGTPVEQTEEVLRTLETSLNQTIEEMGAREGIEGIFSRIGSGPEFGGPGIQAMGEKGGHLLALDVGLVDSGLRSFSATELSDTWKLNTPEMPGLEFLAFRTSIGGPGGGSEAVDVLLKHPDTRVLEAASKDLSERLKLYEDLTDVDNGFASGKPQLDFTLSEQGRDLGLTSQSVAIQMRDQFYGAEALREQVGRNEVKVMVRLPKAERSSERDLGLTRVVTPMGGYVALEEVASFERNTAPNSIGRRDGFRVVNVKAGLAPGVVSSAGALSQLRETDLVELRSKYPGLQTGIRR